ncbi:MAG: enoyl-CoA hydratase/isomerase family protein [Terriglobales bacterium]
MPPSAAAGAPATRIEPRPLAGAAIELHLESPDGLNRLSLALLDELSSAPLRHPEARGFVLTGNEHCFSAGADLAAIGALDGATAWRIARAGQRALERIHRSPVPFVAAVAGNCVGGGLDLALACRARLCTANAYFGHHGARLGLVTGWGGTQRLPRLIGAPRTLEHLSQAQGWSAAAALDQGLVAVICAPDELLARAARLADAKLRP